MRDGYLSTGEAAKFCSVTRDTIFKWIQSGRLPALRTAGGHHRIRRDDLSRVISPVRIQDPPAEPARLEGRKFRYCWEHHGNGEVLEDCVRCAVYQLRALRCYELAAVVPEARREVQPCSEDCADCEYYKTVREEDTNILVVTDDKKLAASLIGEASSAPFNMRVADCEYDCSTLLNDFRPDFFFVDCELGAKSVIHITRHLAGDPRVPVVRIILAGSDLKLPADCEKNVFARIERPFNVADIDSCISFRFPS